MMQPLLAYSSTVRTHNAGTSNGLHLAQNAAIGACTRPWWGRDLCLGLTQSAAMCFDLRLSRSEVAKAGP